jgi:hypothetical protein
LNNADIKIVGAVSDQDDLDEIESIAKVFAYEQRMKDYTSPLHAQYNAKKMVRNPERKIQTGQQLLPSNPPHILVKGLC